MDMQPPPGPVPPPPPRTGKGIPALGWVGIGCGTVLLFAIAAFIGLLFVGKRKLDEFTKNPEKIAAELMVRAHPELTVTSRDDDKGEMKLKTRTGEEFTVSYKDLSEGRFAFQDSSGATISFGGSTDLVDVPAWVPRVPDTAGDAAVFNGVEKGKVTGFYNTSSNAAAADILTHFENEVTGKGFTSSRETRVVTGGTEIVTCAYSDAAREINVVITTRGGTPAFVRVGYQEK